MIYLIRKNKTKNRKDIYMLCELGGDLISRAKKPSTIGANTFNWRVRNGIEWFHVAITTKITKHIKYLRFNCDN